jgi:hypothetical protein
MRRGMSLILLCCALLPCVVVMSCKKLPAAAPAAGMLKVATLQTTDGIPLDFGNVVGVTSSAAFPGWGQLWFESADKTIRVVRVNFETGQLNGQVVAIPRR